MRYYTYAERSDMAEKASEEPGPAVSGQADTSFGDAISSVYESRLVPMLFEPYAVDMARRVAAALPARVLEIAAGTGVLTRAMATTLPASTSITATDLNQSMLDRAASTSLTRPVTWRQADANDLPFADAIFDVLVCQFGVMFFPDKAKAFSEARRVLRPSGVFLFSVWDRIEDNDFADAVTSGLASVFPNDPPRFMARTPHGYHDRDTIMRDMADAGFAAPPHIVTLSAVSHAPSAGSAASALCHGTPLRNEIVARDATRLDEATGVCARALEKRFGAGAIEGPMRALIVTATCTPGRPS